MKKVITDNQEVPTISLKECEFTKIYAYYDRDSHNVFKLVEISSRGSHYFRFIPLAWLHLDFNTFEFTSGPLPCDLIERQIQKGFEVFEFDNKFEFLEWATKQLCS